MVKKALIVLFTTLLLTVSISLPVFGDTPTFVESPTNDKYNESTIVDGRQVEGGGTAIDVLRKDGCIDTVVLTPFKYKDNIKNVKSYKQICDAYESIKSVNNLEQLNPKIKKIANDEGANTEDLSVRYLFDVTIYEDHLEKHDDTLHETYTELHVEFGTLENFICLMMYKDGKWLIVEDVILDPNDPTRMFIPIITGSASYAIVCANAYNYEGIKCDCGVCCDVHWILLFIGTIVMIVMLLLKDNNDEEGENKPLNTVKFLILAIDILLSLIIYIFFKQCELDIIALVINYIVCLISVLLSAKNKDEKEYY